MRTKLDLKKGWNRNEEVQHFTVSEVRIRRVEDKHDGLLAWASCVVNNALYLNNIAVRRNREGSIILTFPARKKDDKTKYFHFHPVTQTALKIIKDAITEKLNL